MYMYTIYIYQFDNLQPPPPRLLSAFTWYNPSKRANQKLNIMSNWQRSAHYAYTSVYVCVCVERAQKLGLFQQDHSVKRICIHCVYIYSYVNKTYHRNDREKKREREEGTQEKRKTTSIHPHPTKRSFIFTASPPPKRGID